MNPICDTIEALVQRYPYEVFAWCLVALLPLITSAFWTFKYSRRDGEWWPAFRRSVGLTLGYPAALMVLVVVPLSTISIYIAPALMETYPGARPATSAVFGLAGWLGTNAFWLAPLVWLGWVVGAPARFARPACA